MFDNSFVSVFCSFALDLYKLFEFVWNRVGFTIPGYALSTTSIAHNAVERRCVREGLGIKTINVYLYFLLIKQQRPLFRNRSFVKNSRVNCNWVRQAWLDIEHRSTIFLCYLDFEICIYKMIDIEIQMKIQRPCSWAIN